MERKEVLNELYDSALLTPGAVAVSMLAKKALNMPLGTPESIKGTVTLAKAAALSSVAVKWAQEKNHIPTDPFKSS